jgi:hypothetical protein
MAVVPSARRYDPIVFELIRELDDPTTSMAETCRRVAERAQELGFTRPSLVHLRRFVRIERDIRAEQKRREEALADVVRDVAVQVAVVGRVPEPHWVIERVEKATGWTWE